MGRMAEEPGNRNSSVRHALVGRDRVDLLVEFREPGVIQKYTFKEAILEGGPGLNNNFLQAAVIKNAAIPVDGAVNLHVNIDPCIDHAGIGDTELQLVKMDFLFYEFAE